MTALVEGAAGSAESSIPFSEKSHTLSPRGEPAKTFPAERIATYCSPSCWKVAAVALAPAPV